MEQTIIGKLQAFNAEVFRTEDYKKVKTNEDFYPAIGDFAAYLDDDETDGCSDIRIETINEPFDMSRVICTT